MKIPLKTYQEKRLLRVKFHQFFFILHEIPLKRHHKSPDLAFETYVHGRDIR
jgi:hypothetical protein